MYKPGDLVTTQRNHEVLYGRVLHLHQGLVVADWYLTPARRGYSWQEGFPLNQVGKG